MSTVTYMPRQSTYNPEPVATSLDWEPEAADVASWLQYGQVTSSFSLARMFGRAVAEERSGQRLRAQMSPGQRIVNLSRD